MNVPNTLTALRIAAVPVFIALFVSGRIGAALGVFIGAMVTDMLDGIAARVLKQFAARPFIFPDAGFAEAYDRQARENLARELATLGQ